MDSGRNRTDLVPVAPVRQLPEFRLRLRFSPRNPDSGGGTGHSGLVGVGLAATALVEFAAAALLGRRSNRRIFRAPFARSALSVLARFHRRAVADRLDFPSPDSADGRADRGGRPVRAGRFLVRLPRRAPVFLLSDGALSDGASFPAAPVLDSGRH